MGILKHQFLIQSVINQTTPKFVDPDEDDVDDSNNLSWNEVDVEYTAVYSTTRKL